MTSSLRSSSPSRSPALVGDNTMEALTAFLQDMTKTIEILCNKCNTVAQTGPSDVRTSLSIGIPTTGDVSAHQPPRDLSGSPISPHTLQPPLNNGHVMLPGHSNDEGKFGHVQQWFTPGLSFEEKLHARRSNIFETEAMAHRRNSDTNSQASSFETKNGVALRAFLEDMKKTIQAWSARHSLLVQGKAISIGEGPDMEINEATRTAEAVRPHSNPSDSNAWVIDQLDFGADGVSFPCDKDQDVVVLEASDLPNPSKGEASEVPQSDHGHHKPNDKAEGTQPTVGNDWRNSFSQADQGKVDATSFTLHEIGEELASQLRQPDQETILQKAATVQEPSKGHKKRKVQPRLPPQVDAQRKSQANDRGEMSVDVTCRNDSGEVDNFVTPKDDKTDLKIQTPDWIPKNLLPEMVTPASNDNSALQVKSPPYRRRVEVVTSPEWLPQGWITEVKTRGSGNSAGTKDKYYVDPVSKRRFRSKTEVFCFLETGKRGRYKRKPKTDSPKRLPGTGTELRFRGKINQAKTSEMAFTSMPQHIPPSISGPSPVTPIPAPAVFMPFRPGQPPEWLVYESLAGLPFPVFEHFRYPDFSLGKSNGNRGPAPRPWFFNNSEGSWRPFIDTGDLGKSAEKNKHGGKDTIPKQSTTGGKRSAKKSST